MATEAPPELFVMVQTEKGREQLRPRFDLIGHHPVGFDWAHICDGGPAGAPRNFSDSQPQGFVDFRSGDVNSVIQATMDNQPSMEVMWLSASSLAARKDGSCPHDNINRHFFT